MSGQSSDGRRFPGGFDRETLRQSLPGSMSSSSVCHRNPATPTPGRGRCERLFFTFEFLFRFSRPTDPCDVVLRGPARRSAYRFTARPAASTRRNVRGSKRFRNVTFYVRYGARRRARNHLTSDKIENRNVLGSFVY